MDPMLLQPLLDVGTKGGAARMPWGGMACLEGPCSRRRLRGIAVRTCRFGSEWAALSAMQRFQLGGGVLDLDAASGLSLLHPGSSTSAATQVEEEGCFLRSIDRRCGSDPLCYPVNSASSHHNSASSHHIGASPVPCARDTSHRTEAGVGSNGGAPRRGNAVAHAETCGCG